MREAQLAGDLADLRLLGAGDRLVRGRDREQAVEQLQALLARGHLPELAGHQEVLRPAEEAVLALGDLHHERRLVRRHVPQGLDDPLHLAGSLPR